MTPTFLKRARVVASAALLGGCISSSSPDYGDLAVFTQGDVTLEDGLKSTDVVDGWTITFERFVVNVGGVALGTSASTASTLGESNYVLVDQALPGPKLVIDAKDVLARTWPSFSFTVRPARTTSELAGGVTDDDLVKMRNLGASMWVKGSAKKGDVTKTFDWVFNHSVSYEACQTTTSSGTLFGVDVDDDEITDVSIVFRGRTLFEDGIGASKPALRFDPIAQADTNADGVVAANELAALPLAAVRANHGFYGTASSSNVNTLRDFLDQQAQRLVAFQGTGTCTPRRL
jgi:hypothetical protein